jgi:RimJ/RimL family protein N-acetyltransferase
VNERPSSRPERLIQHGFEGLGLAQLHAVVEPPNVRSSAVALRLGIEHRGRTTAYYGGLELEHHLLRNPGSAHPTWRAGRPATA